MCGKPLLYRAFRSPGTGFPTRFSTALVEIGELSWETLTG
jgi:hypothetical protein